MLDGFCSRISIALLDCFIRCQLEMLVLRKLLLCIELLLQIANRFFIRAGLYRDVSYALVACHARGANSAVPAYRDSNQAHTSRKKVIRSCAALSTHPNEADTAHMHTLTNTVSSPHFC